MFSVSWVLLCREISGVVTSETHARLAGLDGVLEDSTITWSNGVKWSRKEAAALLAPPEWKGMWHGKVNNNDVSVWLTSPTRVVAEGMRNGKKWKADGHVSGDMIYLFGISGKVHPPPPRCRTHLHESRSAISRTELAPLVALCLCAVSGLRSACHSADASRLHL